MRNSLRDTVIIADNWRFLEILAGISTYIAPLARACGGETMLLTAWRSSFTRPGVLNTSHLSAILLILATFSRKVRADTGQGGNSMLTPIKGQIIAVLPILATFRRFFICFSGFFSNSPITTQPRSAGGVAAYEVLGATIRAFRLAAFLDRQVYLGVRIPQVHPRHRARQRQFRLPHLVAMLCIGRNEVFVDGACSGCHGSSCCCYPEMCRL